MVNASGVWLRQELINGGTQGSKCGFRFVFLVRIIIQVGRGS